MESVQETQKGRTEIPSIEWRVYACVENGLLDLVYCNCMQVPVCNEHRHVTCSSIEEYIKHDHHLKGIDGETVP
jgi:hypothetical protein